jgi:hypothetical protein
LTLSGSCWTFTCMFLSLALVDHLLVWFSFWLCSTRARKRESYK